MSQPDEEEPDPVADELPTLTAETMNPLQLGDCLEELAFELRQVLNPAQVEALQVAAYRVRRCESLRDALLDRVERTLRLERELERLTQTTTTSPTP